MKHYFTLLMSLLISSLALAQPPDNDNPGRAINLPISTSPATCPTTIYSNVGATATPDALVGSGFTSPSCYQQAAVGFNFTVTRDVWFKFTAPLTGSTDFDISLKKTPGSTITQLALSVYRGDLPPGNLDQIACEIGATLGTTEVIATVTSPIIQNGGTYYIRVDGVGGVGIGSGGDFTVCVRTANPIYYMGRSPFSSSLASGTLYDSGGPLISPAQPGNYATTDDHVFRINRAGAGCMEILIDSLNINGTGVLRIIDEITGDTIDNIRGNASGPTSMRIQVASSQIRIEFKANGVLGTGFKLTWLALPTCTFPPPTSCGAPQMVTLPYVGVNQTTCTDELRGVVAGPCGAATTWQGRDRIISFTSSGAQCIKVSVGGYNLGGMGVGLFKGCPAAGSGSSCVATGAANGAGDTVYIQNARLELPGTYYIVLSRLNGCTKFNINIDTISCLNVLPGAGSCETALSLNDCSNTVPADVRLGLASGVPPTPNLAFPNLQMGCFLGYNATPGNYKMVYFKFRAGANGKFAFRVRPNVAPAGKDIDFNVWGPINSEADICTHIGTVAPVRSSWAPATAITNTYGTGLSDTLFPAGGGAPILIGDTADCAAPSPVIPGTVSGNDGVVRSLDVIAGKYYMVFLNDFSGTINTEAGVNLNFNGTSDNVLAPFSDPASALTVMPSDTIACPGSTMQFRARGGVRYTWSPPNTLDTAVIAAPRATFAVQDTTYSYQVQIQGTCRQVSRSVNVQIFGLRKPNDETVCINQRLQWNVGQRYSRAGVSYAWSASTNAAGMAQLDVTNPSAVKFTGITPGTHVYTVQLITPVCTLSQTFTITVTNGLAPAYTLAESVKNICIGTNALIGPTGVTPVGTTFNWTAQSDPYTSIQQNPTVSPPVSLRYYVLMTSVSCPAGIRDSVDVNVYRPAATVIPSTALSLCENDSVRLGATPLQTGARFRWTPAIGLANGKDTLPSPMVVAQNGLQRYTLTATTGGGVCSVTKTIDVTGRNYKVVLPDTILFCASNDTLRIRANPHVPDSFKLAWSWRRIGSPVVSRDTQLSLLHRPRFATQYIATLDTNGCRRSDTTLVLVDSLPFLTTITRDSLKPSYCEGEIIILKTVPAYDPIFFPRLTSLWQPNRHMLTDSTLFQLVIVADTPSVTYYRTVRNGGCVRKDSTRVDVNPVPELKITGLNPICIGDTIRLTASSPKPVPSLVTVWEWRGDGTSNPTIGANFTYKPPTAGAYKYNLQGKTTTGCNAQMDYTVVVKPLPSLSKPIIPAICPGETFLLNTAAFPGATYSWTGSGGFTSTLAQPSVVPAVDNATYIANMDLLGCKKTDSVKVTIARATLTVSPEVSICAGTTTTLTATGTTTVAPSIYSWTPSGSLTGANTATPIAAPTDTTTYSVIYRYGPNCTLPAKTVKVNVIPNFTVKITPPQDSFTLKLVNEGDAITWSSTVTGNAPGATYSWAENGKDIGTTTTITAKLNAPDNEFINGQDGKGYKVIESKVKSGVMRYKLTVKSTNGCSATKEVGIRLRHPRFGYPNAFTPNNDTVNAGFRLIFSGTDFFNPMEQNPRLYKGNVQVVSMQVYSRVGMKVYEETNLTTLNAANYAGWNGNLNNEATKELPSDSYVYIIKVLMPDGTTKVISDEIVLVR
jgi:CHU_C Type IX secretion signal domain